MTTEDLPIVGEGVLVRPVPLDRVPVIKLSSSSMIRRKRSFKLPWRDLRRSNRTIRGCERGFAAASASIDSGRLRLLSVPGTGQNPLPPRPQGSEERESRLTQVLPPQRDPSCLPCAAVRSSRRPEQSLEAATTIS